MALGVLSGGHFHALAREPMPTTTGWYTVCLSVRDSDLFRAELRTFASFDLEDSDDLAALPGKRYGLCVALGCTSRLSAVSIALDR
jgi:hypothetical protein